MSNRTAILCALLSVALFGSSVVMALELGVQREYRLAFALACCALVGFAVGLVWRNASWRVGLWIASSFWLFFLFVFLSLLGNGQLEWSPLLEAVLFAGGTSGSAALGSLLGNRIVGHAIES